MRRWSAASQSIMAAERNTGPGGSRLSPACAWTPGWGALTAVDTPVQPLLPPLSRPAWMGPRTQALSSTFRAHVPGLSSGVWDPVTHHGFVLLPVGEDQTTGSRGG